MVSVQADDFAVSIAAERSVASGKFIVNPVQELAPIPVFGLRLLFRVVQRVVGVAEVGVQRYLIAVFFMGFRKRVDDQAAIRIYA